MPNEAAIDLDRVRPSTPHARRGLKLALAAMLVAAAAAGLAYRAIDRGIGTLGCHRETPPGTFVAYCASPQFGDYEHGAYYYRLEPRAVAAARQADVLFFGSSRAQFAFSTQALRDYFSRHSIRHHLLGFGYYEQGAFPLALVRKEALKPKVIVIGSDPFFVNRSSGEVRMGGLQRLRAPLEYGGYMLRRAYLAMHASACGYFPGRCDGRFVVTHRSFEDGHWRETGIDKGVRYPVPAVSQITYGAAQAAANLAFAEEFLRATGVRKECVVLTAPPSTSVNADAYITEMGRLLGVKVVLPSREGLETIDENHLALPSAERWSGDILREADALIRACVGKAS